MGNVRMIARPVTIGHHPHMLPGVHINSGDPAIGWLEKRKTSRPLWKSAAVSLFLAVGLYLIFSEGFGVVFAF